MGGKGKGTKRIAEEPVEDKQAKVRHVSEEVEEAEEAPEAAPPVDAEEEERQAWLELRAAFGEDEELPDELAVGKPVVHSEMPVDEPMSPVELGLEKAEGEDDVAEA